jgi:hypothetical protein
MEETENILFEEFEKQVKVYISQSSDILADEMLGGMALMGFVGNLKQHWHKAPQEALDQLGISKLQHDLMLDRIVQRIMDKYMKFG